MQRHLQKLTSPDPFLVSLGRPISCCIKTYMVPVTTLLWLDLEVICLTWYLMRFNIQHWKIKQWDVHFLSD